MRVEIKRQGTGEGRRFCLSLERDMKILLFSYWRFYEKYNKVNDFKYLIF